MAGQVAAWPQYACCCVFKSDNPCFRCWTDSLCSFFPRRPFTLGFPIALNKTPLSLQFSPERFACCFYSEGSHLFVVVVLFVCLCVCLFVCLFDCLFVLFVLFCFVLFVFCLFVCLFVVCFLKVWSEPKTICVRELHDPFTDQISCSRFAWEQPCPSFARM